MSAPLKSLLWEGYHRLDHSVSICIHQSQSPLRLIETKSVGDHEIDVHLPGGYHIQRRLYALLQTPDIDQREVLATHTVDEKRDPRYVRDAHQH